MELAAALALFGSIVLFALAHRNRGSTIHDRMRVMSSRHESAPEDEPFHERVVLPAANALGARITEFLPPALLGRIRRWLIVSNSEMALTSFLLTALILGAVLPLLYLLVLLIGTGGQPAGRMLLPLPLIAAIGVAFPVLTLRRRALDRQTKILKALPDSLDLLTTCVEAGLSLDYAFQRVSERQRGPVADEINRMLREKALGQPRKEALTAMAERIDLPDVNVFVQSVIQAETMGTGIASTLRTQSRQLRIRRRQRAEQAAQTAGPKMVFPLVFFVMPSLFIVILGPVALSAWEGLGGF
jgi:tight adherence protein C